METPGALWGPRQTWTVEAIEIGDQRDGEVKIQLEPVSVRHFGLSPGDRGDPHGVSDSRRPRGCDRLVRWFAT
jgi:hypothetical protein